MPHKISPSFAAYLLIHSACVQVHESGPQSGDVPRLVKEADTSRACSRPVPVHTHTQTVGHYTASTIQYYYTTNVSILLYYMLYYAMLYFVMLYYMYMLYYTCSVNESPCKNTSLHIYPQLVPAGTDMFSPLGYFIHGSTSTPA